MDSSTRSIILQPYNWADTAKVCESFYFRFLSMVQKLHSSVCRWLIKAPPPMRPPYLESGPLKRCQLVAKFTRLHLFLLFLAYCCVHFLTLINNSSIFQRTFSRHNYAVSIHRGDSFLLFPSRGFTNLLQSYKV